MIINIIDIAADIIDAFLFHFSLASGKLTSHEFMVSELIQKARIMKEED